MTMGKEASLDGLEFDGDTVLCRVCGDKASGFHYGVHACEGCKGFFRRSIQQKIQYRPCLKNQQCNIMRVNRNRCQYCRLQKCIAVGMSRDAVRFGRVPKKEKARIIEQMHLRSNTSQGKPPSQNSPLLTPTDLIQQVINAHRQTCAFSLEQVKQKRISALSAGEFADCPAQLACPLNAGSSPDGNESNIDDCSINFTPSIKSVVDFAKCVPGFSHLNQDDQVTLLKAATFEVLLVRMAALFDSTTNTMMFINGKIYRKDTTSSQVKTSALRLMDAMFDFAQRFNAFGLNDDEIALFSSVVLLSPDRPGLKNQDQVESMQNKLTECLQNVINSNHHQDSTMFAKLLLTTTELRTLNTLHSEKSISTNSQRRESMEQDSVHDIRSDASSPSPSDCSSQATGYDSMSICSNSDYSNGAPMPAYRLPLDSPSQHLVLKTPYGTFYREENFYGMVPPDIPRRRCHTLDREMLTRPTRLHTIEEGNKRRNTLDKDYLNKMVNKLSDRFDKRAVIRGDSLTPSMCSSTASSPIPEEYQRYLSTSQEFIPISTADSSASSSRAVSPYGHFHPDGYHINRDSLLPYSPSPSSPDPRSRSGSVGEDYNMRRRCYSFHITSEGHAARALQNQGLLVPGADIRERISPEEFHQNLLPEMRRGSVGADYGIASKKKSLMVDRHPAYLSRLPDSAKKKTDHMMLSPSQLAAQHRLKHHHHHDSTSAFDNVTSIKIPVPRRTEERWTPSSSSSLSFPVTSASLSSPLSLPMNTHPLSLPLSSAPLSLPLKMPQVAEQDSASQDSAEVAGLNKGEEQQMTVDEEREPMEGESEEGSNTTTPTRSLDVSPAEVFHKKFDKLRKRPIQEEKSEVVEKEERKEDEEEEKKEEAWGSISQQRSPMFPEASLGSDNHQTPSPAAQVMRPKQERIDKSRLSAGEAHPQLLAHLKSPAQVPLLRISPQGGFADQGYPVGASMDPALSSKLDPSQRNLPHAEDNTASGLPGSGLQGGGVSNSFGHGSPAQSMEGASRSGHPGVSEPVDSAGLHASTRSHLKDKLLRKIDSMDNLHKVGLPAMVQGSPNPSQGQGHPSSVNPMDVRPQLTAGPSPLQHHHHHLSGQLSHPQPQRHGNNKPELISQLMNRNYVPISEELRPAVQPHFGPMGYPGQVPMHPAFMPGAQPPGYTGPMASVAHMPGYNQHLAGMQHLAQIYGGQTQLKINPGGQPLNLARPQPPGVVKTEPRAEGAVRIKEEVDS